LGRWGLIKVASVARPQMLGKAGNIRAARLKEPLGELNRNVQPDYGD